jgi:CelD/BcsL family acetyltransferase involved in cellulose biosynthesis
VRQSSNLARATRLVELEPDPYSFIRLPSSYEQYLESRSKLFRRNVRRARRIAHANGFRVEHLDPASFPAERIPEIFLQFHLARFGDASAFHQRPEILAFAQMALPALFARGQIVALALYRESEIVGIDICLVGYDSLCAWNGGYPPDVEQWSPGRLLVDEGIQIAFRLGLKEYDMLRGAQEWKRSWTNELREVGRIKIAVRA